jgi:hypothetical protein
MEEERPTPARIGFKHFQKAFDKLKENQDLTVLEVMIEAYFKAYNEASRCGMNKQEQNQACSSVFRFATAYGYMSDQTGIAIDIVKETGVKK